MKHTKNESLTKIWCIQIIISSNFSLQHLDEQDRNLNKKITKQLGFVIDHIHLLQV